MAPGDSACRQISADQLEADVEGRLRRAGVPIGPGTASYLFVRLGSIEPLKETLCAFTVPVELQQVVVLVRDTRIMTFGMTWHQAGLGGGRHQANRRIPARNASRTHGRIHRGVPRTEPAAEARINLACDSRRFETAPRSRLSWSLPPFPRQILVKCSASVGSESPPFVETGIRPGGSSVALTTASLGGRCPVECDRGLGEEANSPRP